MSNTEASGFQPLHHSDAGARERGEGRWLMQLRRHGEAAAIVSIAAPLASGALLLLQVYVLADILDKAVAGSTDRLDLIPDMAVVGALMAIRILLGLVGDRAAAVSSERILLAVRGSLFGTMLANRPDWSAARASGALSAVIVDQVDALDGFFAKFLPAMVQASILPIAFAVVILPFDWVIGLLFITTAPLIPLFMALVGWGAEAAKNAEATAFTRLSSHFSDRLRGILTLKLFGREKIETEAVRSASEQLRRRTMSVLRIAFLSSAVLEFFAALGVAGVALYVGLTYLGMVDLRFDALTLKVGLFCLMMAPEVYQPLRLLAAHYHDRAGAKAAVSAIAAQFETLPETGAAVTATPQTVGTDLRGLSTQALTVRAPGSGVIVLDSMDLTVEPGRHIAIVGPSGCGKSTLLEALAGLREISGTVLIGGGNLDALADANLRANLAFLSQRPRIFQGSIADNIRLGRRSATDSEVREAARLAQVGAFADLLPEGLGTAIGDGGLGLSGGEAHRVALARLYLRDPKIVLLDEPTAHLDTATERLVIDGILEFTRGRTLLVATHSAGLAARMDLALRIAGGRLMPALHPRTASTRGTEGAA